MTNKSNNKYATFLTTYTIFDALLYPVDTIKNILYSETHAGLSNIYFKVELRDVLASSNLPNLYRGIVFKLAFNIPLITSLYLTTQSDCGTSTILAWMATAALYPLNTIKVRAQLMPTYFSVGNEGISAIRTGLYRGLVPFLLLNSLLGWSLRPLLS